MRRGFCWLLGLLPLLFAAAATGQENQDYYIVYEGQEHEIPWIFTGNKSGPYFYARLWFKTSSGADGEYLEITDPELDANGAGYLIQFTKEQVDNNTPVNFKVRGVERDGPQSGDRGARIFVSEGNSTNINLGNEKAITFTLREFPKILVSQRVDDPDFSENSLTVTEGDYVEYKLALSLRPIGGQTSLSVHYDHPDVSVSPGSVTFPRDTNDWKSGRVLRATTTEDDIAQGDRTVLLSHLATGGGYFGVLRHISLMIEDDDTAGIELSSESVRASENGGTVTYTARLTSEPTEDVIIDLTSGDETIATVAPATLTFTADNWDTPQTVTVTGVNDDLDNINLGRSTTISHVARAGGADEYDGLSASMQVRIDDDERKGIAVSHSSIWVNEGAEQVYTVKLNSQPTAEVTVKTRFGTDATTPAPDWVKAEPAELTFTADNWDTAQEVKVQGVEDHVDRGDRNFTLLSHGATGGDYDGLTGRSVNVWVRDNDTAGVTVSRSTLELRETASDDGPSAGDYTVVLDTQPAEDVIITVASGDTAVVTVSTASLTFTTSNWNTPQTVTVTAVNDDVSNSGGSRRATVSHSTTSTYYTGTIGSVAATVHDDDGASTFFLSTKDEVIEGDKTVTFTVNRRGSTASALTLGVEEDEADTDPVRAIPEVDYEVLDKVGRWAPVTFAAGSATSSDLRVQLIDDEIVEPPEDLVLSLWDAATRIRYEAGYQLQDDDIPAIILSKSSFFVTPDSGDSWTVSLAKQPSAVQVTVTLTTDREDLNSQKDFFKPKSITFGQDGSWDDPETVEVALAGHKHKEVGFTVTHTASVKSDKENRYNGVTAGIGGTLVSIPNLQLDGPKSVTEGAGNVTWTLRRRQTQALEYLVTARYGESSSTQLSIDGATGFATSTAEDSAAADFTQTFAPNHGTTYYHSFIWAEGSDTKELVVNIGDDQVVEGLEEIQFRVLPRGHKAEKQTIIPIALVDNDTPSIVLGSETAEVSENGGTETYTVKLGAPPMEDVTISVVSGDTSAATVSSATLTFTTENWDDTQTVTITGVNDDTDQENDQRTATLTHTATSPAAWTSAEAQELTVTVTDDEATPLSLAAVDDQTWMQNSAITKLTLPEGKGGKTPLTYTLTPALPAGLTWTAAERTITGTPTAAAAAEEYTYTVTDADSATAAQTFSITVTADLTPTLTAPDDQVFTVGVQPDTVTLPEATGGDGTLTYTLTPDLPAGLAWTASARTITGTPTESAAAADYTYKATDADGDEAEQKFSITVNPDLFPSHGNVANQTFLENSDVGTVTLAAATGGNGTLTYALTPDLPAGLAWTASARTITGTPTAEVGETEYTYTVTDKDGDTDALTFTITVSPDLSPTLKAPNDFVFTVDVDIGTVKLPAGSGGNGDLSYELPQAQTQLPPGLTWNVSARTITGTPTSEVGETEYSYIVKDEDGDSAEQTFTITVVEDLTPALDDPGDKTFVQNSAGSAQLPKATGGNGALAYALSPETPDGLTWNASSRTISGTPTTAAAAADYTYKATDADGDEAEQTFTITVAADLAPTVTKPDDLEIFQGVAMTTETLPAATGGNGDLNYELSPALPEGLSWDASARTITGTPTKASAASTFAYSVHDEDGDEVAKTFSITVRPPAISLSLGQTEVAENVATAPDIRVTASITNAARFPADSDLTVSVGPGGTATEGTDYKAVDDFTIRIPKDTESANGSFKFDPEDDELDEGSYETVTISGTLAGSTVSGVNLQITDDDSKGIVLSKTEVSVGEAGATNTWTVKLGSQPTAEVTVAVASDATGSATVSPASLTFTTENWDDTQTVTVTGVNDDFDNTDNQRKLNVSHEASGGDYQDLEADVAVTVTDDDTRGLALPSQPLSVGEAGGTATYKVKLTSKPTAEVTVEVSSDDKSAALVSVGDGEPAESVDLTFTTENWNTEQTVKVTGVNDDYDNAGGGRDVTLDHDASGGDYGDVEGSLTVKVQDLDSAPEITLSVSQSSVAEDVETAPEITVTATVTGSKFPEDQTLKVKVGATTDTATEGTDYETVNDFDITIAKDATTATGNFTLTPTDDSVAEGDESISVEGTLSGVTVTGTEITLADNETKSVKVSKSSVTLDETGSNSTTTYTVVLTSQPTEDVTVTVSVADTTVKISTDGGGLKKALNLSFTSSNWDETQELTITAVNNYLDDPDDHRDTTISHTAKGGDYEDLSGGNIAVRVDDDDDPAELALGLEPSSVAEDLGEAKEIKVTASITNGTRFLETKTIAVTVGDSGTATEGTDYAAVSDFSITIVGGTASGEATFEITPTSDRVDEGTGETVGVAGTLTGFEVNGADLQITDNDTRGLALSKTSVSVAEAGGTETYTVKLTSQPTAEVKVTVTSGIETAAKLSTGTGTPAKSVELTFTTGNWNTTQEVTVTGVNDDEDNAGNKRAVTLSHKAAGGDYGSVTGSVSVDVNDDDSSGVVLSPTSLTVGENGGTGTYTVKLASAPSADVTVKVTSSNDTIAKVSVGEGTPGNTLDLTFTTGNWNTTQEVKVTGVNDNYENVNDKRLVSISHAASGGGYDETASLQVTVSDDDAPVIGLSVDKTSVAEDVETAPEITVTATLSGSIRFIQDRILTIQVGSSGTAKEGTDYAEVADFGVTFPKDTKTVTKKFTLNPTDDFIDEGDHETVGIGGWLTRATVNGTTVQITDNDSRAVVVSKASLTVAENGGEDSYTVKLRSQPTETVTVTVASKNEDAATVKKSGGTAGKTVDLTFTTGNWSTAQTVTVTGVNDDYDNGSKRDVSITHAATGGDYQGVNGDAVVVSVTDDEDAPSIALSLSQTTVAENVETAPEITVTATVSNSKFPEDKTVTVKVGASGTATEGTDYKTVDDFDITITAGDTTATGTFTLDPEDDKLDEGTGETVGIASELSGFTISDVTLTITDNDSKAVVLSKITASVGEDADTDTWTVKLGSQPTADVTVTVASDATGAATVSPASLTFTTSNWGDTQEVTVTGVNDDYDNTDNKRTATVNHTAANGGYNGIKSAVTVTVNDDDTSGLALPASLAAIAENGGTTSYTVKLTSKPTAEVTVSVTSNNKAAAKVSVGDGTPAEKVDLTFTTSNWDDLQTVKVTGVNDDYDNAGGGRDVKLSHAASGGDYGSVTGSLDLRVTDDDSAPEITLSVSQSSVAEDVETAPEITVTATVTGSKFTESKTVSVAVGASGDSATEGTDYETVDAFDISIAKDATSATGTFTLTPKDDDLDEDDETISVTGTLSGVTVKNTSITLKDNETKSVKVSKSSVTLDETGSNSTTTYTVVLTSQPTEDVTVTVSVADTTVKISTDGGGLKKALNLSFTTSNWDETQELTITAVNNYLDDPDDHRDTTISHTAKGGDYEDLSGGNIAVRVDDDDDPAELALGLEPSSVAEDLGEAKEIKVTASITNGTRFLETKTIAVTVGDSGTATEGTDYAAVSDFSITIVGGTASGEATFEITPTSDRVDEGTGETVGVAGTLTGGFTVNGADLQITDNDTRGLALSKTSVSVAEAGGTETYTVKLTSQPTAEVKVTVTSGIETAAKLSTGTGTPAKSVELTFTTGNWNTTQEVTVTGVNDDEDNAGDKRAVTLSHKAAGGDYGSVTGSVTVDVNDDDSSGVVLSPTTLTVGENGGTGTYTVKLASAPSADVTVTVTSSNDTIAKVSVGEGTPGDTLNLTFTTGNWNTTQEVKVTGVNDNYENVNDKRLVSISHAASGGGYDETASLQVTVSDDDAPVIGLSVDKTSVAEDVDTAPEITVTATLSGSIRFIQDRILTIQVGSSGTAKEGTDYAEVADFGVTFPKDTKTVTKKFTLNPTDDFIDEGDHETVGIGGWLTRATVNGTTVQITDNDSRAVVVSKASLTVAENGGEDSYTVKLRSQPTETVTVTVASKNEDAATVKKSGGTAGESVNLSFTEDDWSTAQTVTVTGVNDDYDNGSKRDVSITHAAKGGDYKGVNGDSVKVSVTDDEDAATITLSLSPTSVLEDVGSAQTITAKASISNTTRFAESKTIAVTVGDSGTATKGTDYGAVADFNITIGKGASSGSATFEITPTSDQVDEGSGETVGVAGELTGFTIPPVMLTITDNDSKAVVLSKTTASVGEDADTDTWTVKLGSQPTADVTVTLASNATGSATVSPASLTFTKDNWNSPQTVTVTGVNDDYDNTNDKRTATVSHTAANGGYTGVKSSVTVTVNDDDTRGLELPSQPLSVGEAGGTATYKVKLTSKPTAEVTVTVKSDKKTAALVSTGEGTPAETVDLTFTTSNWDDLQTVKVTGVNDDYDNAGGGRDVTLEHEASGGDYEDVEDSLAVKVTDDDGAPAVTLSVNLSSVAEDVSTAPTVTVTAAVTGSRFPESKTVSVAVGASSDSATEGTDYETVDAFDITIAKGAASATGTFTLTPKDDDVDEDDETISVAGTLSGVSVTGASITLTDDDTKGLVLSESSLTVAEAGGTETYTVKLSSAPTADVTVTVSSNDENAATVHKSGGTAGKTVALTFTTGDWNTTQTVTVTGVNDDLDNPDNKRAVTLSHSAAKGGYDNVTGSVSVDVTDDDGAPTITLSVDKSSVTENVSTAPTITVTATVNGSKFPESKTLSVAVGATSDTATEGTDYETVDAFDITINKDSTSATGTFTLTPEDDDVDEDDETISVAGTLSGVSVTGASITLTDDDTKGLVLSESSLTVAEAGGTETYTVKLSSAPTADVTVTVSSNDENAATVHKSGGTAGKTVALTFTTGDWNTAQTVTVTGVNDDLDNPDNKRAVTLSHTAANGGYGNVTGSVSVDVTDDDGAPTITLSVDKSSVAENVSTAPTITVTATVNGSKFPESKTLSVAVGATSDSATEGTDYETVDNFDITINKDSASATGTFMLTPKDDDVDEDDESISVEGTLSSPDFSRAAFV